jgi:tetratricopeptide (TPR) repeat protein
MRFFYCALACLTIVSAVFAADTSSTVLVTDFKAPPGETWSWAQLAVAELAVEALNMHGIFTVDRDLLSAVEKEHALSATQPQKEGLKAGHWLGATFLLKGELESLQGSRVRLSATLTRVETVEQVTIFSVEGDYTTELQPLVGRLVAGLAKGASLDVQALKLEQVNPVKPEALIFFQKGVDACAAGKPSLAVGFFRIASDMAPKFLAAREWEVQAYSLGGLPQHAAALRTRVDQLRGMTQQKVTPEDLDNALKKTLQPVVSVLMPVVPKDMTLPESIETLRHVVEQSVLACGKMRLYQPEQLSEALTEADRQLSLQFSRSGTSRYARWLSADFLIFTRVEPLANGNISLKLDVRQAFSSVRVATLQRETSPAKVKTTLASMVREWQASATGHVASASTIPLVPLTAADFQRFPERFDLVQMLDLRMREPKKFTIEQHLALAASFSSQGSPEVFKLETEEAIRKADSFAQHLSLATYFYVQKAMDLLQRELEKATKKAETLAQHQQLADSLAEFKKLDQAVSEWKITMDLVEASPPRADSLYDAYLWASDFVWDPALAEVLTVKELERVTRIRTRLLAEFPVSLEVFTLRYMESYRAYEEENWAYCLTNSVAALDALDVLEKIRREAKLPPPFSGNVDFSGAPIPLSLLRAPLLYQHALSLESIGDRAGAREFIEKAIATGATGQCDGTMPYSYFGKLIRKRAGVPFGLPANGRKPQDHKRWKKLHCSFSSQFDVALKKELAKMDAEDAEKAKQGKIIPPNEEMMELLAQVDTSDAAENARFVGYVCDVWKGMPPSTNALCPLVGQVVTFLNRAGRAIPESERLQRVEQVAQAYLRVTGADAGTLMACREIGWVTPRLTKIVSFYLAGGLETQGINRILPFLDAQVDAALGVDILMAVCEGLPMENAFRLWKIFRENHKGKEGSALVLKQYCERLMERAQKTYAEDPLGWYKTVTQWQACSTNFTVSVQQAEYFVPRVAVMALPSDSLAEASRILQRMNLSPGILTNASSAWRHWYKAGAFHLDKGNPEQSLQAFRNMMALREWGARPEDWHTYFMEGKALAATGQPAEAAKRFRRISQELGTRAFVIDDIYLPLGLMSARESLQLHVPESGWAAQELEERELCRFRELLEAASKSKLQVEEGALWGSSSGEWGYRPSSVNAKYELLACMTESEKPLNLSLDWTRSVCGTNPVAAEDLCLRAISLLQNGSPVEAKELMERAHKVHPEGYFCFTPVPYESCKMTERHAYSLPVVYIWLARAHAGAGDIEEACEAYVETMSFFYLKDNMLVRLGQEYERLTGQRFAGNPQDGQQYRLAILRCYAEKKDGWRWAQFCIAREGLGGSIPLKDCLRIVDLRLQDKPKDVEFIMFKALFLLKEGKAEEVLPLARKVIEKEPGNQPGRYALGTVLLEAGDTDGALREFRLVCQVANDNSVEWYMRYRHRYRQLSIVSLLDILAKQSRETAVKSQADTSKR